MSSPDIVKLEAALNKAAEGLLNVTSKKMFGCHALWADENVFALVWKHGRIGFKLPNEVDYNSLMNSASAVPWKAGPMQMAHWVLVPESFHAKPGDLKKWATKAHELCLKLEKKPKKATSAKSPLAKNTPKAATGISKAKVTPKAETKIRKTKSKKSPAKPTKKSGGKARKKI
jgi:TfoX/Sxy family transcriptional regulator of competence genes